ncbi:glycosyltransferase family 4 protein [Collimonas antrihumi]|uniref:glycosyltransferase family 4 protein n=1 Tax=Collimonas antrihumi TaxID=1940615 RepID=UPI001B8C068C|nr:glycosyltransferase family 4 protein [Collimonas antrihumi]
MKVLVIHNILWTAYKAAVFSELFELSKSGDIKIEFVQIAETSKERIGLSKVNYDNHRYPYTLLFKGAEESVNPVKAGVALINIVRQSAADTVLIPGYHELSYWIVLLYAKLSRRRVIVSLDSTMHDRSRKWYKEAIKRFFIRNVDGGFCYGTRSAEYLHYLGMPLEKISVRCQTAAIDVFEEALKQSPQANWQSSLSRKFLYVGRLAAEKNLERLIIAFAEVAKEHSNASLVLVGDGPDKGQLQILAKTLGVSEKIVFAGGKSMQDLVEYYQSAFCLVLPSTSEPWGLVVNEAFIMGCPAVVSNQCGCAPDLMIENATGFVVDASSTETMVIAMGKMLRLTADQRLEMGLACKAIISKFTPKSAAAEMYKGFMHSGRQDDISTVKY